MMVKFMKMFFIVLVSAFFLGKISMAYADNEKKSSGQNF
jgi:cbb3-type cytochrome oxidase subunit 3